MHQSNKQPKKWSDHVVLIIVIAVVALVAALLLRMLIVLGIVVGLERAEPFRTKEGISQYDKAAILDEYGGDFDSGLLLFPDQPDAARATNFYMGTHTGVFDTDGYLILEADYSDTAYAAEVLRLKDITTNLRSYRGDSVSLSVQTDVSSYRYPAVVASDGFDCVYEYALLDEENHRIVYVLLSYPRALNLERFSEYLKIDRTAYEEESAGNTLLNFTIYAHSFDGGESYVEYSDSKGNR